MTWRSGGFTAPSFLWRVVDQYSNDRTVCGFHKLNQNARRLVRILRIGGILIGLAAAAYFFLRALAPTDVLPISNKPSNVHLVSAREYNRIDFDALRMPWIMVPQSEPISHSGGAQAVSGFVGAQACSECHGDYYDSFVHTSHFKTSATPNANNLPDCFGTGRNVLTTAVPEIRFEMSHDSERYYQVLYATESGITYGLSIPIELVFGSGKIAQTYGYWNGDHLYELPVTYFREEDRWISSPGYQDGTADFARPIEVRCLECHLTYAEWIPGTHNAYRRDSLILGVSCERCHGPGMAHIEHHRNNPKDIEPRAIVHPGELSRELRIELCSQCHLAGGTRNSPPFSFRPGDLLAEHVTGLTEDDLEGGVHTANQSARMKKSRCYTESDTLSCTSCHDPHVQERERPKVFAERCLSCHERNHCGQADAVGTQLESLCIDCHMPLHRDDEIRMEQDGGIRFPLLRDHFVRVSRSDAQQILDSLRLEAAVPQTATP